MPLPPLLALTGSGSSRAGRCSDYFRHALGTGASSSLAYSCYCPHIGCASASAPSRVGRRDCRYTLRTCTCPSRARRRHCRQMVCTCTCSSRAVSWNCCRIQDGTAAAFSALELLPPVHAEGTASTLFTLWLLPPVRALTGLPALQPVRFQRRLLRAVPVDGEGAGRLRGGALPSPLAGPMPSQTGGGGGGGDAGARGPASAKRPLELSIACSLLITIVSVCLLFSLYSE